MEPESFQRTRTIRFKLESINTNVINQKIATLESVNIDDLNQYCIDLVVKGQCLSRGLKSLLT